MSDVNPYAAPQTLAPLASPARVLPLAEERPDPARRILFPETSTMALERIEAASRAIRRMTVVWTVALACLIIGLCVTTLSGELLGRDWLVLAAGVVVLAFRLLAGVERGPQGRYFSLVIDLLPCLAVVYAVGREQVLKWQDQRLHPEETFLGLVILGFSLYLPWSSVLAHVKYSCLFGDERMLHDDLARELTHRRHYRIS